MVYRLAITPQQRQTDRVLLTPKQHHYVFRVLRLNVGDRLIVLDGQGQVWLGSILPEQVQIIEPLEEDRELPLAVTLATALPKGNGMDEIIRPCTELGATQFQPILSHRTLLKPSQQRQQRWQRIATEAAEQSERRWIPPVRSTATWADYLATLPPATADCHYLLCVTRHKCPGLGAYLKKAPLISQLVIATGPEGGWTASEIDQALTAGFELVSLGKRVLRAITAPTTALAQVVVMAEI